MVNWPIVINVTLWAVLLVCGLAASCTPAYAGALDETRYCTSTPSRDAEGNIARRSDVLRAFRKQHPCPGTPTPTGACPGWSVDHVIPLVCGGCDAVSNMTWLHNTTKSCAGVACKDRWERRVYCR